MQARAFGTGRGHAAVHLTEGKSKAAGQCTNSDSIPRHRHVASGLALTSTDMRGLYQHYSDDGLI